jgi:hypothetical protein
MEENIFFDEKIENIIKYNKSTSNTHLLLSLEETNYIIWSLNIENEIINENFISLINYIIPMNIYVTGIIQFGNIEDNITVDKMLSIYSLLKTLQINYKRKFLNSDNFYFLIYNPENNKITGRIYNMIDINENSGNEKLKIIKTIDNIVFKDFLYELKNKYFLLRMNYQDRIIIQKENIIKKNLIQENLGFFLKEYNKLLMYNQNENDLNKILNVKYIL